MKMEEVAPLAAEVVIGRRDEADERREEEEEEEEEGMSEKGEEEMILCGCTIDKFSGMEMAGPKINKFIVAAYLQYLYSL
jgi:hypothetical protein